MTDGNKLDTNIIQKNKMLFIKRFCYLASNADLLYTLLHIPLFQNQVYEIVEVILFDNHAEQFDHVVSTLNELNSKIQMKEYNNNLNYTTLILQDMFWAITNHEMPIGLKSKKLNMLIQYHNFFFDDNTCSLACKATDEKFLYSTIGENEFINIMAHHCVYPEEVNLYVKQQRDKILKKAL